MMILGRFTYVKKMVDSGDDFCSRWCSIDRLRYGSVDVETYDCTGVSSRHSSHAVDCHRRAAIGMLGGRAALHR